MVKKLFAVKSDGTLWREEEGDVYSIYNHSTKEHIFLDSTGNVIDNYTRFSIKENAHSIVIEDPDFLKEIGEGFYVYTTHKVEYDVDGCYGLFGIKYINGEKLTEEIYYQVGRFCNGLCSVKLKDSEWGCINTSGDLVIPYKFGDEMFFNKYGVAVGDNSLIDKEGNEIPDTMLNCEDDCYEDSRYFVFSFLNEEQCSSIARCGTAPDIKVNIYDTKNRRYVVKGIPECRLDIFSNDVEPEVILAAAELLDEYESVSVLGKGTIIGKANGYKTVYDYYQE